MKIQKHGLDIERVRALNERLTSEDARSVDTVQPSVITLL